MAKVLLLLGAAATASAQKCIGAGVRDPKYVRASPGPEGMGYDFACASWKDSACCTAEYSQVLSQPDGLAKVYGNNWTVHQCNRTLSPQCLAFMIAEDCWYGCDPYSYSYESSAYPGTLQGAPLCRGFCNAWYEACKDDFTCNGDWWSWTPVNGSYPCAASGCKTFGGANGYFRNGTDMCLGLWGPSFTVSDDNAKCFSPLFYGANPNRAVALPATPCPTSGASGQSVAAATVSAVAAALLVIAAGVRRVVE